MTVRSDRDRGMATVTGLVLVFAFTAGAMIWLARDVNRSVSNRAAAQSIAFQAARSGAQQLGLDQLRSGAAVEVDRQRAVDAAYATADELIDGYALSGEVVNVSVFDDRVQVEVIVHDRAGDVHGVGAARAETEP